MRKGFIRTMKAGMSIKDQKTAMRTAGLDPDDPNGPVFQDERDEAIASLEQGDELAVASAECLGHPESDVLVALAAIGARGGAVLNLSTSERIVWHPDAQAALEFATRAGSEARKAIAAKARRARAESGSMGGLPAIEWDQAKLDKLKAMFSAGDGRQAMADALGVSRATIQRKLRELGLV